MDENERREYAREVGDRITAKVAYDVANFFPSQAGKESVLSYFLGLYRKEMAQLLKEVEE